MGCVAACGPRGAGVPAAGRTGGRCRDDLSMRPRWLCPVVFPLAPARWTPCFVAGRERRPHPPSRRRVHDLVDAVRRRDWYGWRFSVDATRRVISTTSWRAWGYRGSSHRIQWTPDGLRTAVSPSLHRALRARLRIQRRSGESGTCVDTSLEAHLHDFEDQSALQVVN